MATSGYSLFRKLIERLHYLHRQSIVYQVCAARTFMQESYSLCVYCRWQLLTQEVFKTLRFSSARGGVVNVGTARGVCS